MTDDNEDQAVTPAGPTPLAAAHDSVVRDQVAPDPVQARLERLRAEKAARDNAVTDPRLAEIAALEAELDGPPAALEPGAAWSAVPKIDDTPPGLLDPQVAAILAELASARTQLAALQAANDRRQAIDDGKPIPPPDAWLGLACGHSVKIASAIPTEHYCDEHQATVKVVSGYLARTEPEPERGKVA